MITADRARELLQYDEERQCLVWRTTGEPLRLYRHSKGYLTAGIDGEKEYAHRLVWLVVRGPLRQGEKISPIDRDRANIAANNLRKADNAKIQMNAKTRRDNLLGLKGVTKMFTPNGRCFFRAKIWKDGSLAAFSDFHTPEEAAEWRAHKLRDIHGEFARAA